MNGFKYLIQDWVVNKGNIKGQLVLFSFRLAQVCRKTSKPWYYFIIPYLIMYRVLIEWILCIELPWNLRVGSGLHLYHGQALVVNDRAILGRNCVLRHSTTIGVAETSLDYSGRAPVVGNDVDIGSNVVILGDVSVGDGVVIGAGSVVVKSVEAGAVVLGNPARVIRVVSKLGTDAEC